MTRQGSRLFGGWAILRGLTAGMSLTHRLLFIGTLVGTTFATQVLYLVPMLIILHLMDAFSQGGSADTLSLLGVIYVVSVTLAVVLDLLRLAVLARVASGMMRRLYLGLLLAALRFGRAGEAERAASALQDYGELQRFIAAGSLLHLVDLVAVPLVALMMFLMHPVYALVFVVSIGLETGFALYSDRSIRPILQRSSELQAQAAQSLSRRLSRHDEVEGLGLLRGVLRQWQPIFVLALAAGESAARRLKASSAISELLNLAAVLVGFTAGAALVITGRAVTGSVIAAMITKGQGSAPMHGIAGNLHQWGVASLAMTRLSANLAAEERPRAPAAPPGDAAAEPAAGLAVRGLAVTVPGREAPLLEGLDLEVPPGSVLIVTGANGVGKSTLLRTLIGLRPAAAGQVLLDSQDLHAVPRHEIGPRIGFLGQRAQLLNASVMDNISRFTRRAAEAVDAARLVGAHEMIGRLPQGYGAPCGPASGLSGGQLRLIALARTCFATPRLVVMDEPEAGLDPNAVGALQQAVRELRARGCVVVLVTHGAKDWNDIADQELRLAADGRWACGWLREPSFTAA